jgi:hypothetical protein
MPCFPGFSPIEGRLFENLGEIEGIQKVEIAEFSRLFRPIGLWKRAEVELRSCFKNSAPYNYRVPRLLIGGARWLDLWCLMSYGKSSNLFYPDTRPSPASGVDLPWTIGPV